MRHQLQYTTVPTCFPGHSTDIMLCYTHHFNPIRLLQPLNGSYSALPRHTPNRSVVEVRFSATNFHSSVILSFRELISDYTFTPLHAIIWCLTFNIATKHDSGSGIIRVATNFLFHRGFMHPFMMEISGFTKKKNCSILFFFFETEFRSCYPGWSAMAWSWLTATSAPQGQAILPPRVKPPK